MHPAVNLMGPQGEAQQEEGETTTPWILSQLGTYTQALPTQRNTRMEGALSLQF